LCRKEPLPKRPTHKKFQQQEMKLIKAFTKKNQGRSSKNVYSCFDSLMDDMSEDLMKGRSSFHRNNFLAEPSMELNGDKAKEETQNTDSSAPLFECDFDNAGLEPTDSSSSGDAEKKRIKEEKNDMKKKKKVARTKKSPSRRKLVTDEEDVRVVSPDQQKKQGVPSRGMRRTRSGLQLSTPPMTTVGRTSNPPLTTGGRTSKTPTRGLQRASSELRVAEGCSVPNTASSGQGRLASRRKLIKTQSEMNISPRPKSPKKNQRKTTKKTAKDFLNQPQQRTALRRGSQ